MARNQTLLKPYKKARPKQKRIMKGRNNLAQVAFRDLPADLEGFRWLTIHPKPREGKLKGDKFGKERSDFNFLQRKQIN